MNIKWTGSLGLAVVAALSGACGGGGSSSGQSGVFFRRPLWTHQYRVPPSNHLRAVRFANPLNGIIAGLDTMILRTSDGGLTWVQQDHKPTNRGGNIVALDAELSSIQAVGTDESGALGRFWSSENSINWSTADAPGSGSPYTAVDILFPASGTLPADVYYLRQDGSLERRQGAAVQTGDTLITGPAYGLDIVGLAGDGYAVGSNGAMSPGAEIRRTDDFGGTWSAPLTLTADRLGVLLRLFMGKFDEGYACGEGGTILYTNDGLAWTDGDNPGGTNDLPAVTLRGLSFPVDSTTGWVVGDSGNIWKTTDSGATWVQQAGGLTSEDLHDVWFVDGNTGYAVGDNGTVLKCVSGTTWSILPTPSVDPAQFNALSFSRDGQRGLAVGNTFGGTASIYRTVDGGATWTDFSAGAPNVNYTGAAVPRFGSGAVAYVCGGTTGTILRHDGFGSGAGSWTAMTGGSGILNAILFPDDDDHGVCVGDANGIFYTDTGTTAPGWTAATAPPASNYKTVTAVRQGGTVRVYAGGSSGVVAGSLFPTPGVWTAFPAVTGTPTVKAIQGVYDGTALADILFAAGDTGGPTATLHRLAVGGAWGALTTASGVPANGLAFINTLDGWWVGDKIYTTEDGGVTWTVSPDHTSEVLRAVWIDAIGATGYAAGDNGTILKTLTGGK